LPHAPLPSLQRKLATWLIWFPNLQSDKEKFHGKHETWCWNSVLCTAPRGYITNKNMKGTAHNTVAIPAVRSCKL
jgi:hypothetical protein